MIRGNLSLILTRALFVNNETYKPFLLNSQAQGAFGKMNNLPKHQSAGPHAAASVASALGRPCAAGTAFLQDWQGCDTL